MSDYLIKGETLTAIADEVRELSGTTSLKSTDMIISDLDTANTEIAEQADLIAQIKSAAEGLPEAGSDLDTSDATATSGDILSGKTAYVNGEKITGTIPTVSFIHPIIQFNDSTGVITATTMQNKGYVASGGTSSYSQQLAFQSATTITPGTTNQIAVPSRTFVGGAITVKGDANLVAENIVNGKSIFGVVGTAATGGGDTSIGDGLVTRTLTSYTNDRVTIIGSYAFGCCSNLTTLSFPVCTNIGNSAFYYCSKLTSVNFPKVTTIGRGAFGYCTNLEKIYLTASSVCTLKNSNAFSYAGITSTTGSIYVPTSLVTSYKKATNWTYFSKRIFGV